ncbi:MAG TPA: CehA/McbA family metallohydrolase [Anaerolineales bacterium]|nr:CehA/McbA family metallohydrolase [Anaerolineales bacterium]
MHEIVVNLHMHTRYSDGSGTHKDIAHAAMKTGVDVVIVTDHNVLVQGVEGYYRVNSGPSTPVSTPSATQRLRTSRVLLLVGEEIHDQDRDPQKNHLLVFNANRDLSFLADDPQALINGVREAGGLSFIAHPRDPKAPAFRETDISWEAWDVQGYTGIELWNGLSELKTVIPTKLHGAFYAFFPQLIGHHPIPEVIQRWDDLLTQGRPVVAIGGSDAHALHMSMGPLHRVIFPYEFHFKTINTHVFIPGPLTGDTATDKKMIYEALAAGRCFVAYDLPASTRGFTFKAKSLERSAIMGEEIPVKGGVTLQAHLPSPAEIHFFKDGTRIGLWKKSYAATHIATEPGVYRAEVYRNYLGIKRGWIFSNPIYVR